MGKRIGERLLEAGLVTPQSIEKALGQQSITGHRLGDCLVELGLMQELSLLRFLAEELKTRFVSSEKLAKAKIPQEVLDKVPVRVAEAQVLLPVAIDLEQNALSIVMAEPQNLDVLHEISLLAKMKQIYAYVGLRASILAGIKKHYYGDPTAFAQFDSGGGGIAIEAGADRLDSRLSFSPGLALEPTSIRVGTGSASGGSRGQSTLIRDALLSGRAAIGSQDFVRTLSLLVGLLEQQRPTLRGHSGQLARHASLLAQRLGLTPREVTHIAMAAQLHDLGKRADVHLTLASLCLDPKLRDGATKELRAPLKLLEAVHLPAFVTTTLAQLYENFDGSGLPQGAIGTEISVGARILSTIDSFLELAQNPSNPKGRAFGKEPAVAFLRSQAKKLFDPEIVNAFAELLEGDELARRVRADGRVVLVAAPDEALRQGLEDALTQGGLVVRTASTLEAVIEAIMGGEADSLVLGLHFGINDLLPVIQLARAQPRAAGIPIVVVGEPSETSGQERLLSGGADALLPLPLEPEAAYKLVYELFSARVANGCPGRLVQGSFDELPAPSLLEALSVGAHSGLITFRSGLLEGELYVEQGRAVFAQFNGSTGEAAAKAMLLLPSAEFSFDPEALLVELPQLDKALAALRTELFAA